MNITPVKIKPFNYKAIETSKKLNHTQMIDENNVSMSFLANIATQKTADIILQQYLENVYFEEFLSKKGKVTLEEYKDIKKNHPSILLKAQRFCSNNYTGKTTPRELAINALRVNEYFKNNYKNYRIISLGTSPSPITEQLANLGHDVIFLPVSGVRFFYNRVIHRLGNIAQLRALMQYLDAKNIDDGKLNIVLDFTSTGKTLNTVTKFIKEYFGFNHRTLAKVSLGERILDNYYDDTRNHYIADMIGSNVEHISNVPHFPIFDESLVLYDKEDEYGQNSIFFDLNTLKTDFFKEIDSFSTPLARAFSLCTMAEIDKLLSEKEGKNEN